MSLKEQAFTQYTSLLPRSILSQNDMDTQFMKKFFAMDEKLTLSNLQQERQMVSEGLLDYICRFKDLFQIFYNPMAEERLVDICIASMLYVYCPYQENLQIPSFTRLVEFARRTSMSVRKPSKGLTSQVASVSKQSWKRESKKIKATMVEETKKAMQSRKRERSGIPHSFSLSVEKLYSILDTWIKDRVVVLLPCKHKPIEEEAEVSFSVGITGEVIIIPGFLCLRNIFHEKVVVDAL